MYLFQTNNFLKILKHRSVRINILVEKCTTHNDKDYQIPQMEPRHQGLKFHDTVMLCLAYPQ